MICVGAALVAAVYVLRSEFEPVEPDIAASDRDADLLETERLILALTPRVSNLLNTSVLNLQLPDAMAADLFEDSVEVTDVAKSEPELLKHLRSYGVKKQFWKTGDRQLLIGSDVRLWQPVFDAVKYFDRARFKIIRADYTRDTPPLLQTEIGFEATGRTHENRFVSLKSSSNVLWRLPEDHSGIPAEQLKIARWETESFELYETHAPFFEETLDTAISDSALLERLRHSRHEDYILDRYRWLTQQASKKADETRSEESGESGQWAAPHEWFSNVSQDRHPSVSVVDIDQDGFDDLYIMDRWQKNVLLQNRQDGTFEDIAEELGLALEGHCTTAIFADFDNDDDPDCFVGRSLQPSLYLENVDGRFVDQSQTNILTKMPSLVTAASAVDYNGDGLLDIYFSTYAAHIVDDQIASLRQGRQAPLLAEFLAEDDAEHFDDLVNSPRFHRYFQFAGPPNLLLVNLGEGRFDISPLNQDVQSWRHTYQSTWSDFDGDGDPDLYVANDFSVNQLFRNDGDKGFVDVAEVTDSTDIGFGMGAAWGDFDADGKQDLYVSNMFSKAGRRITDQLKIDERFSQMAQGNSLLQNKGTRFEKVSGTGSNSIHVEKAGWSWAGQFCDVDNDGWLDLHALSGYYSPPPEVAVEVDL